MIAPLFNTPFLRVITLGDGVQVPLGAYVEAWYSAIALTRLDPTARFTRSLCGRDSAPAAEVLRQFRRGMHDRINQRVPAALRDNESTRARAREHDSGWRPTHILHVPASYPAGTWVKFHSSRRVAAGYGTRSDSYSYVRIHAGEPLQWAAWRGDVQIWECRPWGVYGARRYACLCLEQVEKLA